MSKYLDSYFLQTSKDMSFLKNETFDCFLGLILHFFEKTVNQGSINFVKLNCFIQYFE